VDLDVGPDGRINVLQSTSGQLALTVLDPGGPFVSSVTHPLNPAPGVPIGLASTDPGRIVAYASVGANELLQLEFDAFGTLLSEINFGPRPGALAAFGAEDFGSVAIVDDAGVLMLLSTFGSIEAELALDPSRSYVDAFFTDVGDVCVAGNDAAAAAFVECYSR
jgi:hypothetical protein